MRNPICKADWEKVREALMQAQANAEEARNMIEYIKWRM